MGGYYDKTIGGWLPDEEKTVNVSGTVWVKYTFNDIEVPEDIDVEEDIKENLYEYISDADYEIEDIDV